MQGRYEHQAKAANGHGRGGVSRRRFVATSAGALAAVALTGLAGCAREDEPAEPEAPSGLSAMLAAPMPALPAEGAIAPGALSLLRHTAQGLYDIDPHSFQPVEGLAASTPTKVSDSVYDVALREGAAFSNGEAVTAADAVAAFERMRSVNGTFAALLSCIDSLEALDDATVRVNLTEPLPLLLRQRLALVPVTIPPSEDAEGANKTSAGSGPWLVSEVAADEGRLAFVPNGHYRGSQPPTCSAMEWRFAQEGSTRLEAVDHGEVLVADDLAASDAEGLELEGVTQEFVPGFASPYVMFNCAKALFGDVRVRQALLYAIDYEAVVGEVFGGRAEVPTGVLPVTHTAYERAEATYSHDAERARQLLERAGVTDLALELDVQDEGLRPLAERICNDWAQVGVRATINAQPGTLGGSVADFDVALCFDDPTLLGFDVDLILTWRYGGSVAPERLCAWSGEAAASARSLMQQARHASDEGAQRELWRRCFAIITEQVPLWPVAFLETGTAWRTDSLRGFEPLTTDGVDFLGVSLR